MAPQVTETSITDLMQVAMQVVPDSIGAVTGADLLS
jgi:hypothetical protein